MKVYTMRFFFVLVLRVQFIKRRCDGLITRAIRLIMIVLQSNRLVESLQVVISVRTCYIKMHARPYPNCNQNPEQICSSERLLLNSLWAYFFSKSKPQQEIL
jgi:hypothetical protein